MMALASREIYQTRLLYSLSKIILSYEHGYTIPSKIFVCTNIQLLLPLCFLALGLDLLRFFCGISPSDDGVGV
jgi:hypothetical protein